MSELQRISSVIAEMKFLLLLAFSLALTPLTYATTSDEDLPLDIQVRAEIDRPFKGWGREPPKDHGKVYQLASITEARSEQQLVMPLDEEILIEHLHTELRKRGYREHGPNEKPELILTILYGRGFLKNPYLPGPVYMEGEAAVVNVFGGDFKLLMRRREYGFEEKLQAANFEKLFIQVNAWAHPEDVPAPKSGKKKKPKLLWKTTMITDDPAHRDLNQFVGKLLAAGSEFFDREIEDEEAFIRTDLPDGFIEYGDTVIINDD
jgi:hypothetical protein